MRLPSPADVTRSQFVKPGQERVQLDSHITVLADETVVLVWENGRFHTTAALGTSNPKVEFVLEDLSGQGLIISAERAVPSDKPTFHTLYEYGRLTAAARNRAS